MQDIQIDDFEEGACEHCGKPTLIVNLTECLMDDGFERACGDCLNAHRAKHTAVEIETFRREMMDEPPLTIRERINLELKEQIHTLAETLCKVVDDREALIQKYENQCRVLAEEVDRRTLTS